MKKVLTILVISLFVLVGCMPSEAMHVRIDGSTTLSVTYTWCGPWSDVTEYYENDVVEHEGTSYVAIDTSTNQEPDEEGWSTYWNVMAEKGETGAQGAQGAAGAQGAQGPQGAQGAQGPQGAAGSNGTNGTNGTNGVSISWQGSSASPPGSPTLNMAYYDTDDKKSYVYDGDSWEQMTEDGATGATGAQGPAGNTNVTTVLKTSDETVNNSNSLQDDDQLTFTVVSGGYYNVWLFCKMTSPATPDFKFAFSAPANSTMVELYNYSGGQIMGGSMDALTEHATNSSGAGYIWLTNTLYAGGNGSVTFRWCQNTANASDTKVLTGSYLIVTKLN